MPVDTAVGAPWGSLTGSRPRPSAPLWVAMYHSVTHTTNDPYRITVSPRRFERQLRWLRRRGLRGVSMAELIRARTAGTAKGLVGLTFDDGYADFTAEALALLRRYECTATVFVLPGLLGSTNEWDPLGPRKPLLDERGVQQVATWGMEVASHGLRHLDLTHADEDTLRREVHESRQLLLDLTGHDVAGFCYPYGAVDLRAVDAVRTAGYQYACAIDPGPLTGRYALPRVHVDERDTSWRLQLKRGLHRWRRHDPADLPEGT